MGSGRSSNAVQPSASLWDTVARITCSVCRPPWAASERDGFDQDDVHVNVSKADSNLSKANRNGNVADAGSVERGNVCAMLAAQVLQSGGPALHAPSTTKPEAAPLLPSADANLAQKKAAHRQLERAKELQNQGADANRRGEAVVAYRLFERAMELAPNNPVHVLSAANMKLKLGLAAPTTTLSPAFPEALKLYERAATLQLTASQRQLLEAKRNLALEAVAQAREAKQLAADQEARAQAAARNTVTQISLSPNKNGSAPRDGFGGDGAKNLTVEQQQAMLDLGLDRLPSSREALRTHVRVLLKTFHPDKQAQRPEGLRLEPTVATMFIRRIKLAAARLMETIQDEDEGYYV